MSGPLAIEHMEFRSNRSHISYTHFTHHDHVLPVVIK